MRSLLFVICVLWFVPCAAGGGKMELPPVKVRYIVRGVYDIRRSGQSIGRENFIRTSLSDNTLVYESVFEVAEGEGKFVTGNNRLEVEEDSGFPLSYYTKRRTKSPDGETVREVTVEMYANVAVVFARQDDRDDRRVMTLPTGCLFLEGNTAAHLAVALERYDRGSGGSQSYEAFDPLGAATTDVTLESVGDSVLVGVDGSGGFGADGETLGHFRYRAGAGPAVDVFVDREGRVVLIDVRSSEIEYALVSMERTPGEGEKSK